MVYVSRSTTNLGSEGSIGLVYILWHSDSINETIFEVISTRKSQTELVEKYHPAL